MDFLSNMNDIQNKQINDICKYKNELDALKGKFREAIDKKNEDQFGEEIVATSNKIEKLILAFCNNAHNFSIEEQNKKSFSSILSNLTILQLRDFGNVTFYNEPGDVTFLRPFMELVGRAMALKHK